MPSPESMQSPENEIGEQAAKFLLAMQGIAATALKLLREKSEARAFADRALATIKERAAKEYALGLEREAAWNKAVDPRNKELADTIKKSRQEIGLEPKGVNLTKTLEAPVPALIPEVGYDLGPRNPVIETRVVEERVYEPPPYTPQPLVTSELERDLNQRDASQAATNAAARTVVPARQQTQALELQQLEQSRGLGD